MPFGSTSPLVGGSYLNTQMSNDANGLPMQGPSNPGFTPGQQSAPLPGMLPNPTNPMAPTPQSTNPQGQSILPQAQPIPQINQKPQIPKSEAELIIEALTNHLKKIGDHREHLLKAALPIQQPGGQD